MLPTKREEMTLEESRRACSIFRTKEKLRESILREYKGVCNHFLSYISLSGIDSDNSSKYISRFRVIPESMVYNHLVSSLIAIPSVSWLPEENTIVGWWLDETCKQFSKCTLKAVFNKVKKEQVEEIYAWTSYLLLGSLDVLIPLTNWREWQRKVTEARIYTRHRNTIIEPNGVKIWKRAG